VMFCDKKDKDAPPGLEGGLLQLPTFSGLLKEINIGETNLEKTLKTDDWSFETEPGVKLIAKTYFPLTYGDPPVGGTAGVFTGVLYTDTIPAWDVDSQTIVFKTVNT